MILDYFELALNSLRHRGLRSWLTMIGIFIGVAAVVALVSLGQGLQAAISQQFAQFGVDKVIIQAKGPGFGPPGSFAAGKLTDDDVELVSKVSGVDIAAGRVIDTAIIGYGDEQQARAVGSLPSRKREAELIIAANNYKIAEGRMLRPGESDKVMVGINYRDGKIFTKPVRAGAKLQILGKKFEVVGVLGKLGDPIRDASIIMDEDSMQELFETGKKVSVIVAKAQEGQELSKVAENIASGMRRDRNQDEGKEDFEIQTPQQLLQTFSTIISIVQAVVIGIAAISIIVGSIGIMNTMYTAVLERVREIGIMKATGARNSHILTLFLFESGIIGLAGGAIGAAIGIAIGKGVELVASHALGPNLLQAYFPWYLILGALSFSFLLGVISGALPALQASRLRPVDALRYE